MTTQKPWLSPDNAETSTGFHKFHIIKDVITFLRKNKVDEHNISYVRKGLNTVNQNVNPLYPWPKKRSRDRASCGWTETKTKFIAFYAQWVKGEYLAIVFTGKRSAFEIPNVHHEHMSKFMKNIVKTVPDSRKHAKKRPPNIKKPKPTRFEGIAIKTKEQ